LYRQPAAAGTSSLNGEIRLHIAVHQPFVERSLALIQIIIAPPNLNYKSLQLGISSPNNVKFEPEARSQS